MQKKISYQDVINTLKLEPLTIEGGFFRETYRSQTPTQDANRTCGTSIYYLLHAENISAWHRVKNDEIWLYHAGSPAVQLLLYPDGSWQERVIGADLSAGQTPQSLIPAGTWQAATLLDQSPDSWGLFGAVVFPAFEYRDFTAGNSAELCSAYPQAAKRIKQLKL